VNISFASPYFQLCGAKVSPSLKNGVNIIIVDNYVFIQLKVKKVFTIKNVVWILAGESIDDFHAEYG